METTNKQPEIVHHDGHVEDHHNHNSPKHDAGEKLDVIGFEVDETQLPKGYYRSRFFIGSFFAIGFGLWAGTGAL
jgi:hypothetical protein